MAAPIDSILMKAGVPSCIRVPPDWQMLMTGLRATVAIPKARAARSAAAMPSVPATNS